MKPHLPVLALCAVALAGCGSHQPTAAPAAPSRAGSATPTDAGLNGEQTKTAEQVLADTKSALFNAGAVHVAGTMTTQGQAQQIDLQLQGQDAAGTPVDIVVTGGKVYIKGPAAFWAKTPGPALAPKLADKWLVQELAGNPIGTTLTLQGIATSLNADGSPLLPAVTRGNTAGRPTVMLSQQDGSTVAVANTGAPVPLHITDKSKSSGELAFTGYGTTRPITAPPGGVTPAQAAHGPDGAAPA